jgi:hypothetical protein
LILVIGFVLAVTAVLSFVGLGVIMLMTWSSLRGKRDDKR